MEVNDLHAQRAEGVRAALDHQQSARSTWRCVMRRVSSVRELRRVSSKSRAGGQADRECDESGEQTAPEEPAHGSTQKSERRRST